MNLWKRKGEMYMFLPFDVMLVNMKLRIYIDLDSAVFEYRGKRYRLKIEDGVVKAEEVKE